MEALASLWKRRHSIGLDDLQELATLFFMYIILPPFLLGCTIVAFGYLYVAKSKPMRRQTVTILVIGDIGRSPRMMYHAESFAKRGWEASVIGYYDTPLIPSLNSLPHVHIHPIASPPPPCSSLPWVARAPLRIIFQVLSILKTVWWTVPVHTEYLLVQNPPSIPTLMLARLIAAVGRTKVIVDWHNEGHSILAMRLGPNHPLVRLARWLEKTFGRIAFAHLFVTRALQSHLTQEWHLQGKSSVLYDRPPGNFRPTDAMSLHELFYRLEPLFSPPIPPDWVPRAAADETLFSKPGVKGMPKLREDRPALVVSSTSWTADEDFGMLLTALDAYQARKRTPKGEGLPKLLVIITGKGALRASFERAVASREGKQWKDVVVRCVFLPARDYPVLLGCADVGISLHTSSSGRDLPMKVVDMFGCGVPVLAKGFPCIGELVKEGQNGLVFESGEELGKQLVDTLDGFPRECKNLDLLKAFLTPSEPSSRPSSRASRRKGEEKEWCTWDENWERVVYHGILGHTGGARSD